MEQEEIIGLLEILDIRLNELIPDVITENPLRSVRAEEHTRTLLMIRQYLLSKKHSNELGEIENKNGGANEG